MAKNWKDKGRRPDLFSEIVGAVTGLGNLPGGHTRGVQNRDSGKNRSLFVGSSQRTGDAVRRGQFTDRKKY